MSSSLVFAQYVQQDEGTLRYVSNEFETLEFNIDDIINNADSYFIRFSQSCLGISYNECVSRGLINEWVVYENNSKNRTLVVNIMILQNDETGELYNVTSLSISYKEENFEFRASPLYPVTEPYLFTIYFVPYDENIDIEQATSIVENELKKLGIADKNTKIEFKEEYLNPITQASESSNQIESLLTNNKYSFFIITILIILMLVIAYFIKKRHRK